MSPIDDQFIVSRIFEKLDGIDAKIDDLCDRTTKHEIMLANHLEEGKTRMERKEKRFYMILGLVGGIVSIVEVVRSGIIG